MEEERLIALFLESTGKRAVKVERINSTGAGGRRYFEITAEDGGKMFGIHGSNPEEDEAFYKLSLEFEKRGLKTPRVYGISEDRMYYLQQYLGTQTLDDYLRNQRSAVNDELQYSTDAEAFLCRVMRELPSIQFGAASDDVYRYCYPVPSMDEMSIMFDLNYFKYCFVKLRGIEFNEVRLQRDFEKFTKDILEDMSDTFLYRDFQARNVMLFDGDTYYIDYQGGRKGPIYYDVASFVWDVPARYPRQLKNRLIDEYIGALQQYKPMTREEFMPKLLKFVLFRGLQVLGAFGFRGLWEKKQLMIDSIPQGLKDLKWLAEEGVIDSYPELKEIAEKL